MIRRFLMILAGLSAFGASPAAAFWEYGHETIATIAMSQVQPRTRASIEWLLKRQAALETPTCPAKTIEEASIWPDCIKPLGDRFAYVYDWHYQNLDVCVPFDIKANCIDGNCVSAQIPRAQRMLADRKLPVRDRLMALAFLVHFMGDIHQPLHVGEARDLGGNQTRVSYGAIGGRTNIHSIWDGLLADRGISTPPAGPRGLLSEATPEALRQMAQGSVEDWVRESWTIAKEKIYPTAAGDICSRAPGAKITGKLDNDAIVGLIPVMRQQVLKGGIRLAHMLDEALDGDHPEVAHPPKPQSIAPAPAA
ncbi:S1/P1 nuclease [Sphingomonas sp. BIUV-7]|uniref:S1/P1 nuclease n=1 Tax=Sphingomonas natans TaxID=3063330 RepID=A0ABT8Y5W3_9SPHN|nr:S1/P1 nuclease [Sphingomonas sp. BIUV-7]MDO6413055.1 S1/P1 nuclease [Sphingomonas sp. BIUV-7]